MPVWVKGEVNEGDYILPSTKNDGTGIAVAPDSMRVADFAQVVGRAWQASAHTGLKLINTVVGMESDGWVKFADQQQQRLDDLERVNDVLAAELQTVKCN